jgi:hypothetical protein
LTIAVEPTLRSLRSGFRAQLTAHCSARIELIFLVLAQWLDPAEGEACIAWARETYATMQPFVGMGRYVNHLDDDEPDDAMAAAYGPNYRRLREIKAKYDSENFFHMNQNIRPLS